MLHKTRGIVFKTVKYSETSIITTIYTEKFGNQTYIISGVRSSKSKSKAALYRHGNLLELVVYHKETGNIMRISEAKFAHAYLEIPFQIIKSSLLLFYIELLNKTLKEHEQNEELFDFLFEIFIALDETDRPTANHHIWFLLALSKYLGFYPASDEGSYFDLREGVFVRTMPVHMNFIPEGLSKKLRNIIDPELINYDQIQLSGGERKQLLHYLLQYYKLHVAEFGEMHSLNILEELFKK